MKLGTRYICNTLSLVAIAIQSKRFIEANPADGSRNSSISGGGVGSNRQLIAYTRARSLTRALAHTRAALGHSQNSQQSLWMGFCLWGVNRQRQLAS